ncbi:hypothetical protein [Geodermatophilus amargosae]|uniref:hypothetical protein n=1 Tax=Geodermatophilus amargosae TaxID=1296565 RepID=UPI000B8851EC|nr:hypothetical protein [Geodermatophilus amargosae]
MDQELNARFYDAAMGLDVELRVVLAGDDASGYSTSSPELPGCVAAADDAADWLRLFREAVARHLG